jgi:hypothetical protein
MVRRYQDSFIAETTVLVDGNAPFETVVRPVTPGGTVRQNHTNVFKQIIALFKSEARNTFRNLTGSFRGYRPREVRGFVVVTAVENAQSHFVNGSVGLYELTPDLLSDVVAKLVQSNGILTLTELEFAFKFFPAVVGGGGQKIRVPTWLKNQIKFSHTWKDNGVNCAAYSICDVLYRRSRHYDRNPKLIITDAKLLCEKLDWSDFISHTQLKEFVDHADYCTWRITVHTYESRNRKYLADYKGNKWTDPLKTISLIYDVTQHHFGRGTVTRSFGNNFKECGDCGKVYDCMYYERCDCSGTIVSRPREKNYTDCEMCGKSISSGKICVSCKGVSCMTCKENYKAGSFHRCIVYKPIKEDEEKIWIPGMDQDGSFPAVWSYDFESFIKYNKTTQLLVVGFKVGDYLIVV